MSSELNSGKGERQKKRRVPRSRYKTNFLSKVVARLDFEPRRKLLHKHPPTQIKKLLKESFPFRELKTIRQQQIEVIQESTGTSQTTTTTSNELQWIFQDAAKGRQIELNETSVLIMYSSYTCYEDLLEHFIPVVNSYLHSSETRITRTGLRYVNALELHGDDSPTDWSEYLKPELLASVKLADDVKTISRAFNVLEFNYGDQMSMRFQFGMPNPDYPAQIKKKLFILDWDAFCNLELAKGDIKNHLDRFHEKINASFEEVITDRLRDKMGRTNGESTEHI